MAVDFSCSACQRRGARYCECRPEKTAGAEVAGRAVDGHGNHSDAEAERLQPPFAQGQPLWLVVNGQPALRYYLRPMGRGHVLAFAPEDENGNYYDHNHFYASKSSILVRQVAGMKSQLASLQNELEARQQQLRESLAEEAADRAVPAP